MSHVDVGPLLFFAMLFALALVGMVLTFLLELWRPQK